MALVRRVKDSVPTLEKRLHEEFGCSFAFLRTLEGLPVTGQSFPRREFHSGVQATLQQASYRIAGLPCSLQIAYRNSTRYAPTPRQEATRTVTVLALLLMVDDYGREFSPFTRITADQYDDRMIKTIIFFRSLSKIGFRHSGVIGPAIKPIIEDQYDGPLSDLSDTAVNVSWAPRLMKRLPALTV